MSSSSESYYIQVLTNISIYLHQYVATILFVIGNIGNLLSILIFFKKSWRKNVCVFYFIICLFNNTVFLNGTLLGSIFALGFNINVQNSSVILCKLFYYIAYLSSTYLPCVLIFASIDRLLISSQNVDTRLYSSKRLVFYSYIFKATTTTARPTVNITQAGDPIVGICNTIAGGNVSGSGVNYPITENVSNAIDGSLSTKYLNFGSSSAGCSGSSPAGINTGFYVTPTRSNASIAFGLLFATANDSPNRDPITVTLEGTNATTTAAFNSGTSWTLIYNGSTGISSSTDPGRQIYVSQQIFSNTIAFRSYRLLVTSKRGTDNSVQYAEAHIVGYI
ncbi:unnamed protein product [Rotaria sp. Silwood2]|nr:unnamed protein product [Rotaria sp. Silwood2]